MFNSAFNHLLMDEGGFVDDKDDLGGKTKYGISKKRFPRLNVENITIADAKKIYKKHYWNLLYEQLNRKIAIRLFNIGVVMGVRRSVKILQRTLNAYFDYKLVKDGIFGQKTLRACNNENAKNLYNCYIFEVAKTFERISYRRNNKKFILGWLNRVFRGIEI